MDITNNRILILGGSGLVGSATCHYILSHFKPSALILAGRSESKIRDVVADLSSFAEEGVLSWRTGDIFSRDAFKHLSRKQVFSDHAKRDRFVKDIIDPLDDDIYRSSFLQQMIHEEYPDVVIDCVNSSTALAYQDVFEESRKLFSDTHSPLKDLAREELLQEVEILLGTQYTPQLIRHIQILWRSLCEHKVKMYVKVGTTGTGGLGLNIPFTHSEDQPSRVLLAKSAMAGAHSMLLFLLGRSALQGQADARWRYDRNLKPLPPIIKEIKPAAVITWKSIDFGEIKHRGQGIRLVDHKPDDALDFSDALNPQNPPWQETGEILKAPYVDTGENGLFSRFEFEALTDEGLMEAITPEEIAEEIARAILGGNSGSDVISALDSAILGPTFRGGYMRERALLSLRKLEAQYGIPSIAFENLGPPKLTKLLYEIYLLDKHIDLLAPVHLSAEDLATRCTDTICKDEGLRQTALSIGLGIIFADNRILRGPNLAIPSHWEYPADGRLTIDRLDHFARKGWLDLRSQNMQTWIDRLHELQIDVRENGDGKSSSRFLRNREFWEDAKSKGALGSFVSWILLKEDNGERLKR